MRVGRSKPRRCLGVGVVVITKIGATGSRLAFAAWSSSAKGNGRHAPHAPFNVIGEHAQENVTPPAIGGAMMNGPDVEIDHPQGAKRAFDLAQ